MAEEPASGLADLLRKMIALGDRYDDDRAWNLMDCEGDLVLAVRDQAKALLAAI